MAKYKKIEDYYTSQDLSLGLDKGVSFKIVVGTPLVWLSTSNDVHKFQIRNTPLVIELEEKVVGAYVVSFGEEAQRAAK